MKPNLPWPLEENEPNRTQTNPIYPIAKMPVNPCPEKHYRKTSPFRRRQNKPNQTQFQTIKAQSNPISNAERAYSACRTSDCPGPPRGLGPGVLAMTSLNRLPFRALRFATCLRLLRSVGMTRGTGPRANRWGDCGMLKKVNFTGWKPMLHRKAVARRTRAGPSPPTKG
jgi:hypothetical protein